MRSGEDRSFCSLAKYADNDVALNKLAKAADLYGLTETSGVEIEEYMPEISDTDAVRSFIRRIADKKSMVGPA